MAEPPFLDTNLFVRHIANDEPNHSPRATAYLARIADEELVAHTSDTVVFETIYVLQSFYRMPRDTIRAGMLPILKLSGIALPSKDMYADVFDLYVAQPSLSFGDCYHVVLMRRLGLSEIVSFDRGFDRIPDITRIEPN